jgi:hypothetical protein
MMLRSLRLTVVAMLPLALSAVSFAQQPLQDRWPTQGQQAQMQTSSPTAAAPKPAVASVAGPASRRAEPSRVIVCGPGVFAKDSSHLKLAEMVEAQNIVYAAVDGPEGSKIMASVLYPKDPKRRLEVLWQDDASRSNLQVISINGQSTWMAPKGLKLGLPLAALEKLNGKPFKLAGFDWEDGGSVRDWMGGALATLPGGCIVGMKLAPDPKTSGDIRSQVSGDKDFLSSDPLVRAAKPTIEEITIGYPQ